MDGEIMKIESLKKNELVNYCNSLNIKTDKKTINELREAVYLYRKNEIDKVKDKGTDLSLLKDKIRKLANEYATNLKSKIISRKEEMKQDDNAHYLIYELLGISHKDGQLIDEYQNTGRFLYKYAGSFLEEVSSLCLLFANSSGSKAFVKNEKGKRPKTFEIDFLNGTDAIELKWRDATTDGDHITKEHTRVQVIKSHGFKPIRVMFYYPQREQAIKIQETLKTLYHGIGGEYYAGDEAWSYLYRVTGYDLKSILEEIARGKKC
jgi:hypothetical protein